MQWVTASKNGKVHDKPFTYLTLTLSLCMNRLCSWKCPPRHIRISYENKTSSSHKHGWSLLISEPWGLLNSGGSALLLDWSSQWWISHLIYCWVCSISGNNSTPGSHWRSYLFSSPLYACRFSATAGLGKIIMARRGQNRSRLTSACSICYTWASSPGKMLLTGWNSLTRIKVDLCFGHL